MNKKILFLTGTRADFGKLKSLINTTAKSSMFEPYIFVTGMHMLSKYGMTANEVDKLGYKNVYKYINQNEADSMDIVLSKTIHGLSDYVKELSPDMIVVHGDRVEALAGATVGSLNNILVAHIEGGEVSGTIDELIRHSVSKMSHVHFVANERARDRLIQLGECENSIFVIGSPDLDIMMSNSLPSMEEVRERYQIKFGDYGVLMYHPVTTELELLKDNIRCVVNAVLKSKDNFIVIYPNNDHGSKVIIDEYARLQNNERFRVFPSVRFEYFLVLLKNSKYLLGNSSAGIREMPFYGIPSINIGSRQSNRSSACSIINAPEEESSIIEAISRCDNLSFPQIKEFGEGNSDKLFIDILNGENVWSISKQKSFKDL